MVDQLLDTVSLGELECVFPLHLVDAVLAKTLDRQVRRRLLPPQLMVYFLLARALLFPQPYQTVLRTLVGASEHTGDQGAWKVPDKAAVFRARRKLGIEPFRELLVHAGSAVADERTPGAFWRGLRVMVLDGTTLQVADSPANRAGLGAPRSQRGATPCPLARLVALVEAGTHVVCDAAVDSHRVRERALAERLACSLGPATLVLAGGDLPGANSWSRMAASGAELLWRVPKNWRLPVIETLPDGSWISTVHGGTGRGVWPPPDTRVRIFEYTPGLHGKDGAERSQLITTLLDPRTAPAAELAALYGDRWEAECTLAELKTTQIGIDNVLPSKGPDLVFQEIYAHLAVNTGLRVLMHATAVNRSEPLDPGHLSFAAALRSARRSLAAPGAAHELPMKSSSRADTRP